MQNLLRPAGAVAARADGGARARERVGAYWEDKFNRIDLPAMALTIAAVVSALSIDGAATAYELSKKGFRTLSIDKLPAAGYGPTSNSCAIIIYPKWLQQKVVFTPKHCKPAWS